MKKINLLNVVVGLAVIFSLTPSRVFADGKDLYDKNCKKCHAEDGSGKKDGKWLAVVKTLKIEKNPEGLDILSADSVKLTDAEMQKVILEGKEDAVKGKMKGLKEKCMTDADADLIVKYFRTLQAAKK